MSKQRAKIPGQGLISNTSPIECVIRLQGYVVWMFPEPDGDDGCRRYEVGFAILRNGNELVIDCNYAEAGQAPILYTAILRRQDALLFQGEWTGGKSEQRDTGTCLCRLYESASRFGFFGIWREGGESLPWCGEFVPADAAS